jgi:glutamate racemase
MQCTVGVFDSGVGGLTVLSELVKSLPADYIYVADSAHAPYGTKSFDFILERSRTITRFLIAKGAQIVVVACNTATTQVISQLRAEFSVDFVGIEPAIKPAVQLSKTHRIGVIATERTLESELFSQTLQRYGGGSEVFLRPGTGLVEAIESGDLNDSYLRNLVAQHTQFFIDHKVDTLVLGCTHYCFITELFSDFLGKGVALVSPNEAIARRTGSLASKLPDTLEKGDFLRLRCFSTQADLAALQRLITVLGIPTLDVAFDTDLAKV